MNPSVRLNDPFLNSLILYLRVATVPAFLLVANGKRAQRDTDDGTKEVISQLATVISSCSSFPFQFSAKLLDSLSLNTSRRVNNSVYM